MTLWPNPIFFFTNANTNAPGLARDGEVGGGGGGGEGGMGAAGIDWCAFTCWCLISRLGFESKSAINICIKFFLKFKNITCITITICTEIKPSHIRQVCYSCGKRFVLQTETESIRNLNIDAKQFPLSFAEMSFFKAGVGRHQTKINIYFSTSYKIAAASPQIIRRRELRWIDREIILHYLFLWRIHSYYVLKALI